MANDSFSKNNPTASSVSANSRLINAEVLTEGQRRAVGRYLELSHCGGVLVGAHSGGAPWDLRPLILEGGAIYMLRFSDPALALDKKKYGWLKHRLEQCPGLTKGEGAGQLWIKRRYYQTVLADDPWRSSAGTAERFSLVAALVTQVAALHGARQVHGNISASNLSQEGGGVQLLDAGFFVCSGALDRSLTTAPELIRNFSPSLAADIFSLGKLISDLLKGQLGAELAKIINATGVSNPNDRPSIESLAALFAHHAGTSATVAGATGATAPSTSLPVGKVISATVKAPIQVPAAAPPPPPQQLPPENPAPDSAAQLSRDIKHTLLIPREVINEARIASSSAGAGSARSGMPPTAYTPSFESQSAPSSSMSASQEGAVPLPVGQTMGTTRGQGKLLTAPRVVSRRQAILALGAILLIAILAVRWLRIPEFFTHKRYDIPVVEYWKSGQMSLMQKVAEAAVAGDQDARSAIIDASLSGAPNKQIHSDMLKFAFDPRWQDALSDTDADAVMRLALAPLYPDGIAGLPRLERLHPLVLIALLGDLPLDKPATAFEEIPSKVLSELPDPLGKIFAPAISSGASLADRSVRSLAHLVIGDSSEAIFQSYFGGADPREQLRTALPILVSNAQLAAPLFTYLLHGQSILSDLANWFAAEDLAQWEQLAPRMRLFIVAGEVPPSGLTLEQYADLLQFPDMRIRALAAAAILNNFLGSEYQPTIAFLGGDSNQLGRFATIALISSFKLDPDSYYSFLLKWFEAKPDAGSILRILLARSQVTGVDPLNFQAASYLKRVPWEASLKDLAALIQHPEGLARVLAYSKLDPTIPNERTLLQEALKREPNDNFRDEIARRIREVSQ